MSEIINACRTCGNDYLVIRTDIHKDGRKFIYCDCCGAMADVVTWQQIPPKNLLTDAFKIMSHLHLWLMTRGYVGLTPEERETIIKIREYESK